MAMLPANAKMPWPPPECHEYLEDVETADAWYSGKLDTGRRVEAPDPRRFKWARGNTTRANARATDEQRVHVPAAADIAQVGADLLFGDPPSFTIPEAHGETPNPVAQATEERLLELIDLDGWSSTLLEGAEIAGALGGVYLRPLFDPTIADHPILTVVHPDRAVPVFSHGRLVEVTFWREWKGESGKVWRHLECHTPGMVGHGLYLGTVETIGARQPLSAREETAGLVTDVTKPFDGGTIPLRDGETPVFLVRYVPNALPNRRHRTQPLGRADTAGAEHLLAALDETWTSWVRDIRLAKARLIVPDEFLDRAGRGSGATFDPDREIFSPLNMDPVSMAKAGIELVQPEIRFEAHAATMMALFTQLVQTAGYSPQSFGLPGDGGQQTATEVTAREGRSEATTSRKQAYWKRALQDVAWNMLWLDKTMAQTDVVPFRPLVAYPDAAEHEVEGTARTLNLLALAKAVSTETKVRTLRPDWTDTEIQAEVDRIHAEEGVMVPDPTGGMP